MSDPITVTLRVTAIPTDDTGPFTRADVVAGLQARLDEFYPTADAYPVVPTVEVVSDGADRVLAVVAEALYAFQDGRPVGTYQEADHG